MNFSRDVTATRGLHWLSRILAILSRGSGYYDHRFCDVNLAVAAIKQGATDFVLKPWQNEKLLGHHFCGRQPAQARLEVANLRSRQEQLSAV